jgi:uncharacterized protein (DUF1697 family)
MNIWIALFRGINVGGNNILPTKSLASLIEGLGAKGVKTYIQSGNAAFGHDERNAATLAARIEAAVLKAHGFKPRVLLLTRQELESAARKNPFPEAALVPTSLHVAFLAEAPGNADLDGMNAIKRAEESYVIIDKTFYMYVPNGVGTSKLAARYEKLLGVSATARNWNTVVKMIELAAQFG